MHPQEKHRQQQKQFAFGSSFLQDQSPGDNIINFHPVTWRWNIPCRCVCVYISIYIYMDKKERKEERLDWIGLD